MQIVVQNLVQMVLQKMIAVQKRFAEMDCRNRAEFGTERLCRKNGTDAECRADNFAELRAVAYAVVHADNYAPLQKRLQKPFAEMRGIREL